MKLTSELVPDTRHWRLSIMFGQAAMEVVMYSTVEDNSMIHSRIPLDSSASDYLAAVEEAVYRNPLLVNGCFDRVCCLSTAPRYAVMPAALDDSATRAVAQAMFGDKVGGDSFEIITETTSDPCQTLVFAESKPLVSFWRRTFTNPGIHHRMFPLLEYFRGRNRLGNNGKMYAHFTGSSVDIIVFGRDTATFVNSFRYREPVDALYYIMAARKQCGLSAHDGELLLAGDAATRKAIMPMLRQYVAAVMPAIFPSALFRAGKEALTAPFPLVILPLL
ncbi:MAG: DUF3822 family protein [Muribaculaceae bacterium]|nr:DUF3822 family protein [Muribaculaceae bacterium]